MEPQELYFCPTCNKPAERVVVIINAEIELLWNEKEQCYEEAESIHNYDEMKSCRCGDCLTELIAKKDEKQVVYPQTDEKVNIQNIIKEEKS